MEISLRSFGSLFNNEYHSKLIKQIANCQITVLGLDIIKLSNQVQVQADSICERCLFDSTDKVIWNRTINS